MIQVLIAQTELSYLRTATRVTLEMADLVAHKMEPANPAPVNRRGPTLPLLPHSWA